MFSLNLYSHEMINVSKASNDFISYPVFAQVAIQASRKDKEDELIPACDVRVRLKFLDDSSSCRVQFPLTILGGREVWSR